MTFLFNLPMSPIHKLILELKHKVTHFSCPGVFQYPENMGKSQIKD